MPLILKDTIEVATRLGVSQVQLYIGDITDLPMEDKVDIVFLSAFPGGYTPKPGTMIHGLKFKLGIDVKAKALHKDLDLREYFSCWMSSCLPEDKPFRRLVCFEVQKSLNQTVRKQISMMFKAMMPIFNGNESSIITPILATGAQGAPLDKMLSIMVSNAVYWIKAGLLLKCIKLVLYSASPDKDKSHLKSVEEFQKIKTKHHLQEQGLDNTQCYDICFCFAPADKHWVDQIRNELLSLNKYLKIHSELLNESSDDSKEDEDVFNIFHKSKRILIVLTTAFVGSSFCLELFSLALCCNRLQSKNVTIPFYVETVANFPSYMNLIQYTECRARKDGETVEGKISTACRDLVKSIESNDYNGVTEQSVDVIKDISPTYDIFVSYSHRNPDMAKNLVDRLNDKYPHLNVFFDRSELKSGNVWQKTLYDAVDQAKCFVAILSDAYIKSQVCQEEFSIACARKLAKDRFALCCVCLPELSYLPSTYLHHGPHVIIKDNYELEVFCEKLSDAVMGITPEQRHNNLKVDAVKNLLSRHRLLHFDRKFKFSSVEKTIVRNEQDSFLTKDVSATLSFSYVTGGLKFAAILSELLKSEAANLSCSLLSASVSDAQREIDECDIVVMFVSDEYLKSELHLQELHMALCRQRTVKDRTVVYLVQGDHTSHSPFYPHVLPFNVCLTDPHWTKLGKKCGVNKVNVKVNSAGLSGTYTCSVAQHLALVQAKEDILALLTSKDRAVLQANISNVGEVSHSLKEQTVESLPIGQVAVSVEDFAFPNFQQQNSNRSKYSSNNNKNTDVSKKSSAQIKASKVVKTVAADIITLEERRKMRREVIEMMQNIDSEDEGDLISDIHSDSIEKNELLNIDSENIVSTKNINSNESIENVKNGPNTCSNKETRKESNSGLTSESKKIKGNDSIDVSSHSSKSCHIL